MSCLSARRMYEPLTNKQLKRQTLIIHLLKKRNYKFVKKYSCASLTSCLLSKDPSEKTHTSRLLEPQAECCDIEKKLSALFTPLKPCIKTASLLCRMHLVQLGTVQIAILSSFFKCTSVRRHHLFKTKTIIKTQNATHNTKQYWLESNELCEREKFPLNIMHLFRFVSALIHWLQIFLWLVRIT